MLLYYTYLGELQNLTNRVVSDTVLAMSHMNADHIRQLGVMRQFSCHLGKD